MQAHTLTLPTPYLTPAITPPHTCTHHKALASPDKLVDMVVRVNAALTSTLPKAISKMQLYLSNPSTHTILFKPVKSNIAEAHGQIAALLAQEYDPQAVADVPLKNMTELGLLLDSMC